MQLYYLTNILDPILKSEPPYKKKIKSVLVSEKYAAAFTNGKYNSKDFDFLLCDNGNFTRLTEVAKEFSVVSKKLEEDMLVYFKTGKPLPKALRDRRKKLNQAIIERCREFNSKIDYTTITKRQLSLIPNGIIGAEDTTIPILQISGAFHPAYKDIYPLLKPFQNQTKTLFKKQAKGGYGEPERLGEVIKYIVVHAIDYNSVTLAVANLKSVRYDGVAISLGGPLARKGSVSSIDLGKKKINFMEPHPESYVLSIMILLAIRNAVSKNIPVHILGLGSPVLILFAAYIFRDFKFVSIDSTATYKDAEVNSIYGNKNGLYKMDLFKLAANLIVEDKSFKGISPYFSYFEKKYPSDWKKLRTRFNDILQNKELSLAEKKKIIKTSLEAKPVLFKDTVPFLLPVHLASKNMKTELRIARSFENYWVNFTLCRKISSLKSSAAIRKYFQEELKKFEKFGSPDYVKAMTELAALVK